ncbi:MAG: twin-arginine translocase TatA/TatE family subunit [Sphingomonas sp.]|uniref:twin-arginine translocase TatA/TatE family subunit n=1 Tax=Sphingomonas sp. TaxID=28214 RepID=UPI0017CBE430|nr:twin-arginine translocase TatA/TatE family subunit [Sphingomonas sp.]MBA3666569.1 twin-arginine translocase TatA/TatE family subunit [Sphingomonas sp.]
MGGFSLWHILIFAIILLLLFGGNRFSSMMGDVAKGLKSFKQGMTDDDDKAQRPADPRQLPPQTPQQQQPIDITPRSPDPVTPPPPSDDSSR